MWRWVLSAALVGTWLPGAATADVYSYKQDNGTLAFTDDPERVPARYRSLMERSGDRPLIDYERLTVREGPDPRTVKRARRSVEEIASSETRARRAPATPAREGLLEVAPGLLLPLDGNAEGDEEPIRVERELRWIDGRYTPVRIVRRGDRVLAISEEIAAPQY